MFKYAHLKKKNFYKKNRCEPAEGSRAIPLGLLILVLTTTLQIWTEEYIKFHISRFNPPPHKIPFPRSMELGSRVKWMAVSNELRSNNKHEFNQCRGSSEF